MTTLLVLLPCLKSFDILYLRYTSAIIMSALAHICLYLRLKFLKCEFIADVFRVVYRCFVHVYSFDMLDHNKRRSWTWWTGCISFYRGDAGKMQNGLLYEAILRWYWLGGQQGGWEELLASELHRYHTYNRKGSDHPLRNQSHLLKLVIVLYAVLHSVFQTTSGW